jgi:hypothetical protein
VKCESDIRNNTVLLRDLRERGYNYKREGKGIPLTGRGGPYVCETLRPSHLLDSRLTNGGEVVSLKRRPPFTPRKIPGTHLYHRLSGPQGHSAAGRIWLIEKNLMTSSGIETEAFRFVA